MDSVAKLIDQLAPDVWREETKFTGDLDGAQSKMFRAASDDEVAQTLNDWLQRHQPCLFGRMAAKSGQLGFCVLREVDLSRDDKFIRDKIQAHRTAWTKEAFHGTKSGFVIVAISERLALAEPDQVVAKIAQRIGSLYLLEDLSFDYIHLEEVFLEQPGRQAATWRWDAGVNYFAAHGDKRWWHDHRIPGGIGFSVNSAGHMARSGLLRKAMTEFEETMGTADDLESLSKIDSLAKVLEVAMRTIDMAADAVSGKATRLLPLPAAAPPCPAALPHFLQGKDYCEYFGSYHTDYTLPHEYFQPDVERPPELAGHTLDFTYLFDDRIDNPDYVRMGTGRRVRDQESTVNDALPVRLRKVLPESIPIKEAGRLAAALALTDK